MYFKVKRLYFFHYPSIRRKDLLPQTNFTKDQQHQKLSEIAYMNTVDLKYIKWHKLFLMALHGVWIAILSVAILRQVYHISIFLLSAIWFFFHINFCFVFYYCYFINDRLNFFGCWNESLEEQFYFEICSQFPFL